MLLGWNLLFSKFSWCGKICSRFFFIWIINSYFFSVFACLLFKSLNTNTSFMDLSTLTSCTNVKYYLLVSRLSCAFKGKGLTVYLYWRVPGWRWPCLCVALTWGQVGACSSGTHSIMGTEQRQMGFWHTFIIVFVERWPHRCRLWSSASSYRLNSRYTLNCSQCKSSRMSWTTQSKNFHVPFFQFYTGFDFFLLKVKLIWKKSVLWTRTLLLSIFFFSGVTENKWQLNTGDKMIYSNVSFKMSCIVSNHFWNTS